MHRPKRQHIDRIPDEVVGRAVQDDAFRSNLLRAETDQQVQDAVWDELEINLTNEAVQQIRDLDERAVERALDAIKTGPEAAAY